MSSYELTPLARADVFEIWSYIAEDNVEAANRVEQAIREACTFVAHAPFRGHTRSELTRKPLRFWPVLRYPNYAVVYRPESKPVQIVAVLHGKRNSRRILRGRF